MVTEQGNRPALGGQPSARIVQKIAMRSACPGRSGAPVSSAASQTAPPLIRLSRKRAMVAAFPWGRRVKKRLLLAGLAFGAFIVTFAISSWHNGLWRSAAEPLSSTAAPDSKAVEPTKPATSPRLDPSSDPQSSASPSTAAPASAATNEPVAVAIAPADASPDSPQLEQTVNPGVDVEAVRRDRGVQRSSAH